MQRLFSLCSLCCLSLLVAPSGESSAQGRSTIYLAGDSTVTDDAGWGKGFQAVLDCTNLAKGGRSSRSYRSEGWWDKCLAAKPNYLLIQFGHNDQPGKGPERESAADGDFRKHLREYVAEAKALGIQPVLVTSLERRRWNDASQIDPSLAEYAVATNAVAQELSVPLIDLHKMSIERYNRLGPTAVRAFEPMSSAGADHTHLNAEGSQVFGRMVAEELLRLFPNLQAFAKPTTDRAEPKKTVAAANQAGLSVAESEDAITVAQGGKVIIVYNKLSPPVPTGIDPVYARSGFIHPLNTPGGRTLTATFPVDHAHQHGLFSAWVKTTYDNREIDFWNLAGKTGRVAHQRVVATFNRETGAGFEVDLVHQTVSEPVVDVLRENWKVVAYPTDGSYFCFDIETKQQALTDKPLIIQEYHYGGMALRGRVEWVRGEKAPPGADENMKLEPSDFLNDLGSAREKGNHEHARWVAMVGELGGQSVSVAVLSHADNFRAPQAARLHPSKPYFCFAPCVDGEFAIDAEHPLSGRYRYLITDAKPAAKWIDEQWRSWCGQPQ